MKIQISMASSGLDKRLESIATMFTTLDEVPRQLVDSHKRGHVLMVAMRPIMGTKEATGENLYGRHWVCMDPKDDMFEDLLKENLKNDARLVKVMTQQEIVGMALVGNRYKDAYLEEEFAERMSMLEPTYSKLQGKTWSELNARLKKAYDQGLV